MGRIENTTDMKLIFSLCLICYMLLACSNTQQAKQCVNEENSLLTNFVHETLQSQMDSVGAESGAVILMECATGQVIESVEIGSILNEAIPSGLVQIPIYLSMLELEAVTDTTTFNTQNGISIVNGDTIRDHTWRVGGFGIVSMKEAITIGSYIAYAKAIDSYGKPNLINSKLSELGFNIKIDQTTHSWQFGAEALTPIQMLNIYTSILNNTKVKEENKRTVLDNMIRCVESGTCKKAQSEIVKIAAYPSRYPMVSIDDNELYHMQLCGFFPTDKPQFCYIVCLNKKGYPASTSSMCSPIIKNVAEFLSTNNIQNQ